MTTTVVVLSVLTVAFASSTVYLALVTYRVKGTLRDALKSVTNGVKKD